MTAPLGIRELSLSEVAAVVGGRLDGPDAPIAHLRPASSDALPTDTLGYATGRFIEDLIERPFAAAIMRADDRRRAPHVPVVIHENPASAFFVLHRFLVDEHRYPIIPTERAGSARVAPSAVVHEGTQIGEDVVVGDHATILPNTIVGDGTRIQAGAVVGEPGFQVADGPEGRFLVPHAGGVRLEAGVSVGANSCVDRAIFSTFTTLGSETMLDNFVHVAHDVSIGRRCTLTAHAELSGSVVLEDDVWIAPRTATNQFVRFGRGAFTGTGSVVIRDVPAFQLVKGNPARPGGFMCLCKTRLDPEVPESACPGCGRCFRYDGERLMLSESMALAS